MRTSYFCCGSLSSERRRVPQYNLHFGLGIPKVGEIRSGDLHHKRVDLVETVHITGATIRRDDPGAKADDAHSERIR